MRIDDTFHIHLNDPGVLPEGVECSHEMVKTHDGLLLSASSISTPHDAEWATTGEIGLSIGFVQGRMRFDLAGKWNTPFDGQFGFCLTTPDPLVTRHSMDASGSVRGLFVHVPFSALDALELRCGDGGGRSMLRSSRFAETDFRTWRPDGAMALLASDVASCPYHGSLRTLFLEAKSLEFLVRTLGAMSPVQQGSSVPPPLSHRDMERFMHARDILVASFASPPTLAQLARQVGISTSRLTAGFRRVFSMSVVEFIQQERLARATEMLRDGQLSISQAAYQVGYTPAHFSTLFRKRNGYPPSVLTGGRR